MRVVRMIKFKYRYCKVQMVRYVSGDLSEAARRRVARYIDECEDCYREYTRHREFAHQLESNLPTLGRPDARRLDQLWSSVQRDLQAPDEHREWFRDFGSRSNMQFSYGLLVVAITVALLLPLMIGYRASAFAVDLPGAPQFPGIVGTLSTTIADRPFAIPTSQSRARRNTPHLQNTPSPRV